MEPLDDQKLPDDYLKFIQDQGRMAHPDIPKKPFDIDKPKKSDKSKKDTEQEKKRRSKEDSTDLH